MDLSKENAERWAERTATVISVLFYPLRAFPLTSGTLVAAHMGWVSTSEPSILFALFLIADGLHGTRSKS